MRVVWTGLLKSFVDALFGRLLLHIEHAEDFEFSKMISPWRSSSQSSWHLRCVCVLSWTSWSAFVWSIIPLIGCGIKPIFISINFISYSWSPFVGLIMWLTLIFCVVMPSLWKVLGIYSSNSLSWLTTVWSTCSHWLSTFLSSSPPLGAFSASVLQSGQVYRSKSDYFQLLVLTSFPPHGICSWFSPLPDFAHSEFQTVNFEW